MTVVIEYKKGSDIIMILKLNNEDAAVASQILKLQKESYKIEADIIDFYDIPPLKDILETIQECKEIFIGYYIDGELAGLITYEVYEKTIDICRLAISPKHFRKGIARKLIDYIEETNPDAKRLVVSTGSMNVPAVTLYTGAGFKEKTRFEVEQGLWITSFEKVIK